jgi:hypothetical protein
MEFKMVEPTYHMDFEGYWTEGTLDHIPQERFTIERRQEANI